MIKSCIFIIIYYSTLLLGEDAIIHFPSDGKSDMVSIRGKEEAVKKAKKALLDEAAALRLQSFRLVMNYL